MKQLLFSCFLFPLLFILAAIFPGCGNEQPPEKRQEPKTLFVFEVENIDSVYYHGKLKYEIRAPLELDSIKIRYVLTLPIINGKRKAVYQADTLMIVRYYPQGLTLKMYSDSLKDTLTLQAKKAVYSSKKRIFEFSGDVRVKAGKGTIFTEQLTFTASDSNYKTDKTIRIITSDSEITGEGFEMNEMFTSYKIHNMKGIIELPPEETK